MNKHFRFFALLALSLVAIQTLVFYFQPHHLKQSPQLRFEEKNAPNDHFFLQHAYPDEVPDIKAYTKAMTQAQLQAGNRSAVLPGFDESWTLRGPGNAGGRINTIAVHPTNDQIMLVGYSTGGIFKTTDGGTNWVPVFDQQPYLAIGHILFDPVNPNIVYAGTGDPNISAYPFIGDGVYRSIDGGNTWAHLGLGDQGIISKIVVDPTNTDIMYAGAMGLPFIRNNDRGVYKTTDGGANWTQVLFLSDTTGVIDLLLNPQNPQVLYAAGWDRIRSGSRSLVFGNGARIHKSTNGGQTWTQLSGGLPIGVYSRIGLAMSGNNPDHVFALYINPNYSLKGVYKTNNAGQAWTQIPTDASSGIFTDPMAAQGWYFGKIVVNPLNEDNIYIPALNLWETVSGGIGWSIASNIPGTISPHVDHHDLAFTSSGAKILATDGGLYRLANGGSQWDDIENIPGTQFYRVAYNPHEPDAFYGGTQDNGTQSGVRGNLNNWENVFGGDGFQPAFHPTNPDIYYYETQYGNIWATNNGGQNFQSGNSGIDSNEPRSWDMQYIISPNNPDVLYTGTNRVFTSTNGAIPSWLPTSPILSNPGAGGPASYHVISTLSESPRDSGLLYVGTSDARVWRQNSSDGQWVNISAGLPGRYVTHICASPDAPEVVFVSNSGYRDNDFIPHIHRSNNRGDTWIDISGDLPPLAVNNLFVMPNNNGNVIFAATDGGVYATINGGSHWEQLGQGMPTVAVYDIDYNVAHNELIAGTYARSIYSFPLDSAGITPNPMTANLSGTIHKETGQGVSGVEVSGVTTAVDGSYDLQVTLGAGCGIAPYKNNVVRNGITVLDLILIQRHILFVDTLDSPYKIIAADVNKSKTLTVLDLIFLQRTILLIDTTWTFNTSWRFIPDDYTFPNPLAPFAEVFPESYDCGAISGNQSNVDFVAIKVGDVNGSAMPSAVAPDPDRTSGRLEMTYANQAFSAGETIDIDLNINAGVPVLGMQFSLEANEAYLEILKVETIEAPNTLKSEVAWTKSAEGAVHLVWTEPQGSVRGNEVGILRVKCKARKSGQLSGLIRLDPGFETQVITWENSDYQYYDLDLQITETTAVSSLADQDKFQSSVSPNPVIDRFEVTVHCAENQEVSMKLFDLSGKLIFTQNNTLKVGENTFPMSTQMLPTKGLYYLEIAGRHFREIVPVMYQ